MTATPQRPSHQTNGLVHPLPVGPLDFVADIHGEIDALLALLQRLGYGTDGSHPVGRRLVFLGDLVDRSPDSPAVVRLVRAMVRAGRAQAVLGNHEFNILRGSKRKHNNWFFGTDKAAETEIALARDEQEDFLSFFASLPLALERNDIRAVHANWDNGMVKAARQAMDTVALFDETREGIRSHLDERRVIDTTERDLAQQNHNPVKLLTSGRETRAGDTFELEGKVRGAYRYPWWNDYTDDIFVVVGHYWRKAVDPNKKSLTDRVFADTPLYEPMAPNVISIDYSVGARAYERTTGKTAGFEGELAALRWPERELVFDHHDKAIPLPATPQPQGAGPC